MTNLRYFETLPSRTNNPSATDEDFERLYPALRDAHMIRHTEDEYEKALARNRSKYNIV